MTMETKIDQILKIVTMNQQDIAVLKEDVKVLKEEVKVLKEDVKVLKEDVKVLKEEVKALKEDVATLKQDVKVLKEDVAALKDRVASLERSVFLIETEHGNQISALFDNMKVNEDKHEEIKDLCLLIESKIQGTLFNHEKRIKKLEGNLVPIL